MFYKSQLEIFLKVMQERKKYFHLSIQMMERWTNSQHNLDCWTWAKYDCDLWQFIITVTVNH